MQLSDYHAYLACFNNRDYNGVLSYFTEDAEIVFAGYCFKGHQAVRDFYAFFHSNVDEQISVTRFVSGDDTVAIEATVRLEGKSDLTQAMMEKKGLGRLVVLRRGQIVDLQQFIHYHLREGKFSKALCSIFDKPVETITSLPK